MLLYLLSAEHDKAERAESLLADGAAISVQVLNEFASVALRKLAMTVTEDTHDRALTLTERHGFAFYDALLIAAALRAGCTRLY